jgi:hypothetical protein
MGVSEVLRMRPAMTVRFSELSPRALAPSAAAQGLEGRIMACSNTPFLCKILSEALNPLEAEALQSIIDFREWTVHGRDRETVRSSFSWPVHRVLDDVTEATVGVLIPSAEARFYYEYAGEYHLREGQHLPRPATVAGNFGIRERLAVARDLARAWDVLDRHEYVYGDANSRNVAFTPHGTPTVFLLDCDGIRRDGDATIRHRTQTRWSDPYAAGLNSIQSDRYLLALWILRILSSSMAQPAPGERLDWSKFPVPLSTHTRLQTRLAEGLGVPGDRPAPSAYLEILEQLNTAGGTLVSDANLGLRQLRVLWPGGHVYSSLCSKPIE